MNHNTYPHRIHILVSDLFLGDAIGNFVLAVRDMLLRRGFLTYIYATRHDAAITNVFPYKTFFDDVRPNDILFYQLSNYDPSLSTIMGAPCRKVVYYHNITPGHFFAPYSPETAKFLDAGRAALSLVGKADALLANSSYSLAEVSPYITSTVPCAFFPPFLTPQLADIITLSSPQKKISPFPFPYLLTLGRVVPHKRVEDAIRIIALLREKKPHLRLVIVGSHYVPYISELKQLIARYPGLSDNVIIAGKLSHADMICFLHNALALLHTSAHEGFCMPVFEAMLANVLVFANNQKAVAETLGGAGILFDAQTPPAAVKHILCGLDFRKQKGMLAAQRLRAKELCALANEDALLHLLVAPNT